MSHDAAARLLVVLASVLLVAAALTGYAWRAAFDSEQFAGRAADALRQPSVRTLIAERVTDRLILVNEPNLLAVRPLVAGAVAGLVGGDAFASLFRRGVQDAHRAVFAGDQDTVTLALLDVGTVAAAVVRELRPDVAAELERSERIVVLERDLAGLGDLARLADRLRAVALVLAALTLLAAGAALALTADRRRTARALGLGLAAAGLAIVVAGVIARAIVLDRVGDPDERAAAAAVWDAFLGDLRGLGLLLAGSGAVVAAAAASALRARPIDLRRVWRGLTTEPATTGPRILRGAALIGAGVLVIAEPAAALQVVATLAGAFLLYSGVEAILRVTYRPEKRPARPRRARRFAVPAVATLLVAGAVAAFAAGGGTAAPAPPLIACNGHAELCDRTLGEVVLPATHNAMSVPARGWFAALQDRPIAGQLEDGIRGLLLDTHYADRLANGRTRTYFGSPEKLEGAIRQDPVSRQSIEAAERLRGRLGFRGSGERGLYLCHTFCELGATPLESVLDDVHSFLVTNPHEVVVIVNQDHVSPADFVAAIEGAGLAPYAARSPWPTLREMIESGRRLVLLAENRAGGAPWYEPAFERLVQDTPFSFGDPSELTGNLEPTCRPNRGPADGPLLLVNHWVNTDPVPRPGNAAIVNAYDALLRRARTCRRMRRRLPNLLAVDFYLRGDLFRVVDTLNDV